MTKRKDGSVVCYKIMNVRPDGEFTTLYHGVSGDKTIPRDKWIMADKKWAGEGGRKYWTGFHVLLSREQCEKYFEKFTVTENRVIIKVLAKNLVAKPSGGGKVFLARWMKIPKSS